MVAEDFLQDQQVRKWLDGVDPAWTLLTFESLRALRQEPSAVQTAIRIANDFSADEIANSSVALNTLILLRQAFERGGLPLVRESFDAIDIKLASHAPSADAGRNFRTKLFVEMVSTRGDFPRRKRAR